MAQNLVMRQMDERQVVQQIKLMLWSPKMDIIATGKVIVKQHMGLYFLHDSPSPSSAPSL